MDETTPPPEVAASVDPGPYARAAWKVRVAVTLFVLVLVLVTGEGLSRLLAKRETPLWRDHPLCWRVPCPDLSLVRTVGDTTFTYETNHWGFRGKSLKTEKRPKDVYRIFFLGDDATLDPQLPESGTFPALVEAALATRRGDGDLKVEVANAAGTGFFLPVLHATLLHRVLPLEPDLVLVMSAASDVRAAVASDWDEEGNAYVPKPEPPRFGDWLCGVSDFAYVIRGKARAWGMAETPRAATPIERLGAIDPAADPRRGVATFRRTLRLMTAACREAHSEIVYLTQPTLRKESLTPEESTRLPGGPSDQLRKGIDAYNEEVRSAAPRDGARLVDLAGLVTRDLEHLRDDVHFTAKGHQVVARVLVEELFKDKPAARR